MATRLNAIKFSNNEFIKTEIKILIDIFCPKFQNHIFRFYLF